MKIKEKIKDFCEEHDIDLINALAAATMIGIGLYMGKTIGYGRGVLDTKEVCYKHLKTSMLNAFEEGGLTGIGTVASFIHDKIPDANALVEEYCNANEIDFEALFRATNRCKSFETLVDGTVDFSKYFE